MCGIVGAFAFNDNNFNISEAYINDMRDAMIHRGPDSKGTWVSKDRRIGLGHRRLSIVDLSVKASQPMSNENETLWVSFNGEIYNHLEIRKELEQVGRHKWKTDHSDTEVILHAFEEWGIDCIHKFRGMFAIALWDVREKQLWLIRDRIGIKPLYYSFHHRRIVFASEIKALLRDKDQKREVHDKAFYHYLSFLTTPAPQTLFNGIKKVPCGTWIRINENGNAHEHKYWDVWDHVEPLEGVSEDEIAEKLMLELRTAIRLHKESDVPLGIFLSGGIDSSTNAVLFSEDETKQINTFSIGYDKNYESYENELKYARLISKIVKSKHHEHILKLNHLIDFLPLMIELHDEPIADPVSVPAYYVSKLARENGVTVCQVGEGADELFIGYPSWISAFQMQRICDLPTPKIFKKLALTSLKWFGKENTFHFEWLKRNIENMPVFWGGSEIFTETQKNRLLSTNFNKNWAGITSWEVLEPLYLQFKEKAWDQSPLNWMTYLDLNFRLPELMLTKIDKMSMGVSLETRVPFLDHKFVELSMSIPSKIKIKNGTLKYILKKGIKGLIPDEIIDRKKQGFGLPMQEWFLTELGTKVKKEITDFCKETDYFNKNYVVEHANEMNETQLWCLVNYILWWKKYIKEEEIA